MEMHEINFSIQITGSALFDNHLLASTEFLLSNFPALKRHYEVREGYTYIVITGELNPHWYRLFNEFLYGISNSKV